MAVGSWGQRGEGRGRGERVEEMTRGWVKVEAEVEQVTRMDIVSCTWLLCYVIPDSAMSCFCLVIVGGK